MISKIAKASLGLVFLGSSSVFAQIKVVFHLHPGIVTNEVSHFFDSRKKSEIS